MPLATIQELARYWADDYDMGRFETRLNAVPQFLTEIDGLDIHFIHVQVAAPNALPLIITHGWPGSIIEMLNVIGPLTDPTAHGGDAADAFDVVVPSMPGYGFSAKPTATGWDPVHIADAWITLDATARLHAIRRPGRRLGRADHRRDRRRRRPPELLGIHSNMPGTVAARASRRRSRRTCSVPAIRPSGLSADEQRAYDQLNFLFTKGLGYALEMGQRPQTLYGLADSPVALAAWMLDHDARSLADIVQAFDGDPVGSLTRDEVLDNITMTWLTNTGMSSGRLYWENTLGFFDIKGVERAGRRVRVPERAVPGAAELDREGLPQPHLLQRARPGQPLRRLAGARPVHLGAARRVPLAALTRIPAHLDWSGRVHRMHTGVMERVEMTPRTVYRYAAEYDYPVLVLDQAEVLAAVREGAALPKHAVAVLVYPHSIASVWR